MKHKLSTLFLVLILLAGVSLLLYPTVSDYWNSFHASQAVASYSADVQNLDQARYDELWSAARDYNQSLLKRENGYFLTDEQRAQYDSLLDITGTGIMGYIEIPTIKLSLPIYHGTEDSFLQIAVGHLDWTSLPTGGESTHSVLSGHRGLPSAKLFTNLDQLVEGDTFVIRVLDEVLTYEVDRILIVEPDDVSEETKIARLNELIKLQTEVSAEQNKKDEGKEFTILIENFSKRNPLIKTAYLFFRYRLYPVSCICLRKGLCCHKRPPILTPENFTYLHLRRFFLLCKVFPADHLLISTERI